ncbi:MAG: hypothetical protein GF350_12130 [Chitinivibrionales bacterium]|nr:hypothetical protein [Chitinivibrionales bacterium]
MPYIFKQRHTFSFFFWSVPAGVILFFQTPAAQIMYPPDIGWINIKENFNAKGDGVSDDTGPIRQALGTSPQDYGNPKVIYFPAGTYRVSSALISERCCLSLRGQGPDHTIIRLEDNARGYDNPDNPKPVFETGPGGNAAHRNNIWDLAVNTGTGNSGAVGITFLANNKGSVRNVKIISEDRKGYAGLSLTKTWPGPCLITDLEVDGFHYGIDISYSEFGPTFEHISLKNQTTAAIRNVDNVAAIRDLYSSNNVPAIISKSGMIICIDAFLENGSSSNAAIELSRMYYFKQAARLYADNVQTEGYRYSVKTNDGDNTEFNEETPLTHYLSHQPHTLFDSPARSLGLPVRETPSFHPDNLSQWENVEDHGAHPDDWNNDANGIQQALNSGKPLVYLPKGFYIINNSLSVPGNVRKILGFDTHIRVYEPDVRVFQVAHDGTHPLIIEMIQEDETHESTIWIDHVSSRTLVLKSCGISSYRAGPNAGAVFLDDMAMDELAFVPSQSVWARQLNIESPGPSPKITNNGAFLWILGMKTEQKGTVIETKNRGQTEFLGTLLYPAVDFSNAGQEKPAFINDNSHVTAMYMLSSYSSSGNYPVHIRETRGTASRRLRREDLPVRSEHGSIVSLYSGFDSTAITTLPDASMHETGRFSQKSPLDRCLILTAPGAGFRAPEKYGEISLYTLQGRLIGKYFHSGTGVEISVQSSGGKRAAGILFMQCTGPAH